MLKRSAIKRRPRKRPPMAERHYMDRIALLGCAVCDSPATLHHVTAGIHGGRIARSNKRIVPLCPRHHQIQWGPHESVEAIGHSGFYRMHNIDLLKLADELWEKFGG